MNRSLTTVATQIGVTQEELTLWAELQWVLPCRQNGEFMFDAADVARVRMILEFHRDLAIDVEAMPVVLSLLDRLHAARARLHEVLKVVADLPESDQAPILRALGARNGEAEL